MEASRLFQAIADHGIHQARVHDCNGSNAAEARSASSNLIRGVGELFGRPGKTPVQQYQLFVSMTAI